VRCEVTPEQWRTEMRLADSIEDPDSPIRTFASFVIEDGKPGVEQLWEGLQKTRSLYR
jgi:alkaline phosphatase D